MIKSSKKLNNKKVAIRPLILGFFVVSCIISSIITYAITSHFLTNQAFSKDHLDYKEVGKNTLNELESTGIVFHGHRDKKQIAITFDAEMTDYMKSQVVDKKTTSFDRRIVDTLEKTNTPATFFLTGMWITLYPKVTDELSQNPLFELGSHSYSDSSFHGYCYDLPELPEALRIEDIGATEKLLREHGVDNQLFRFPGGCYSPQDVALIKQTNDIIVHWDVDGSDGFNNDADSIARRVINNTQNGSIIILHLNGSPTSPKTGDALPTILDALKQKGFQFVKVSELLGI